MSSKLSASDTVFASASRAESAVLQMQRDVFLSDPAAAALLEAMPGPAMILNRNRQILVANHQLRAIVDPDDTDRVVGMRPGEAIRCVHADERPAGCGTTHGCSQCGAISAVLECISTHKRTTRECRITTRGAEGAGAFDLRVHATYLEVRGAEFIVCALEDIGSEKRRSVLEYTFFHDLLNTCGGVQRLALLLNTEHPSHDLEVEWKHEMTRLSDLAVDQIQSQRQLLAAERGELGVQVESIDVHELLQAQVSLYRHHVAGRDRRIVLENIRHIQLNTDAALLGRVIGNLILNALEGSNPGGTVSVSAEYGGGELIVSVHNEGVIPQPIQLQVFQRSFTTKNGEGRGVGAFSVKLLTERYLKGNVEFVSNERLGTLFVIVIPDLGAEARRAA